MSPRSEWQKNTGIKKNNKKRLCQRACDTPNLTQQQLADEFRIGRSSVTKTLLESDRWLNVENDTVIAKCKRQRTQLFLINHNYYLPITYLRKDCQLLSCNGLVK